MDQILEYLQFSTSIPFGYALFYGGLVLIAAFCAVMILTALFKRRFLGFRTVAGTLGIAAVVVVFAANWVFDSQVDLNPDFTDADIPGRWSDGASKIALDRDGGARFQFGKEYAGREPIMSGTGKWGRGDFEITIVTKDGKTLPPLRVIRSGKALRLIVQDFSDPDDWDRHLGFRKETQP